MCDAVIESILLCPLFITVLWTLFIYFSFFFHLNTLYGVSNYFAANLCLGVIYLLEKC